MALTRHRAPPSPSLRARTASTACARRCRRRDRSDRAAAAASGIEHAAPPDPLGRQRLADDRREAAAHPERVRAGRIPSSAGTAFRRAAGRAARASAPTCRRRRAASSRELMRAATSPSARSRNGTRTSSECAIDIASISRSRTNDRYARCSSRASQSAGCAEIGRHVAAQVVDAGDGTCRAGAQLRRQQVVALGRRRRCRCRAAR